MNIFQIAAVQGWDKNKWLRLIEHYRNVMVTPKDFTVGLSHYLNTNIDYDVVRAFVNAGADPMVCAAGEKDNLFDIAANRNCSSNEFNSIYEVSNLYNNCIKSPSPKAISRTVIRDFEEKLEAFATQLASLKDKKSKGYLEQNYAAAYKAGFELNMNLHNVLREYKGHGISLDQLRINSSKLIEDALKTDLAKQPVIYRSLVNLLNFIVSLTVVVPVVTKLATGRWGFFTNAPTETQKTCAEMKEILRGLDGQVPAEDQNGFDNIQQEFYSFEEPVESGLNSPSAFI